jgi:sirohydrochlorin ferrochelatase
MQNSLLITAAFAVMVASGAEARKPIATGTPANVQRLLGCRSIQDNAQRLACFDRETAAVDQAIARKDLVLIDKARATQAKRSLFGFSIPDFGGLFGGSEDEVKEIASTVTAFTHNSYFGWTIRLADGSEWAQTDDAQLGLPPERGQKVVVHRGSFGAFFLRLNGQPGFKVKRVG